MKKILGLNRPVAVWKGRESIDGKIVDTLTIILRTRGCFWAKKKGCVMCGFSTDASDLVSDDDILNQFSYAIKDKDVECIKIYTSGSFLDENEISMNVRGKIIEAFDKNSMNKVFVESRPEFITRENLSMLDDRFIIAMGLETADDYIRNKIINKGFNFEDYERACNLIHSLGMGVKTYLLLKPPFLIERDAISDTITSGLKCSEYSDYISINPCNIQKNTRLERLWFEKGYRPPWLWSCLEVLKNLDDMLDVPIQMDPVGAGNARGPHNCGRCDRTIAQAVRNFSIMNDSSLIKNLDCKCKEIWREVLKIEEYPFAPILV